MHHSLMDKEQYQALKQFDIVSEPFMEIRKQKYLPDTAFVKTQPIGRLIP